MSSKAPPNPNSTNGKGGEKNGPGETSVAKTAAGVLVFSGIALSIIKAFISKPQPQNQQHQVPHSASQTPRPSPPGPSDFRDSHKKNTQGKGEKTVEIVKGDTLWGLSRKYGVSIDSIKVANEINGNTIYAGKKLFIPSSPS